MITHTHQQCFNMIGVINEHNATPIISDILKHAQSQFKQRTVMCQFISHLIIKHIIFFICCK